MKNRFKKIGNSVKNFHKLGFGAQLTILLTILVSIPLTVYLVRSFVLKFSSAAVVQVYLEPSDTTMPPNKTFSLMVNSGSSNISFARVDMTFNTSELQLTGDVQISNSLKAGVVTSRSVANSTGKITVMLYPCDTVNISCSPMPPSPSGIFELVKIPFGPATSNSATTSVAFDSSSVEIVDDQSVGLGVSFRQNTIRLNDSGGGTGTPTPTPTTTPTTTPTPTPQPTTPPTGDLVTLNPVADAFVNDDHRTTNYGDQSTLEVDSDPVEKISFLKFSLPAMGSRYIYSAKLRIRTADISDADSGDVQNVKIVSDNNWGENSITYDNMPSLGSTLGVIDAGFGSKGDYSEIDVTSYVRSKVGFSSSALVSFGIDSSGVDGRDFDSRETSNSPELILDLGDSVSPTGVPAQPDSGIVLFSPNNPRVGFDTVVPVIIEANDNEVIGVDLFLNFDTSMLEATDITVVAPSGYNNSQLPSLFFDNADSTNKVINNTEGTISYTILTPPEGQSGTGTGVLAYVTFKPKSIGSTTVTVSGDTIVAALNVTGGNAFTGSTPVTFSIASGRIPGDINEDDRVDVLDYVILFENFHVNPPTDPRADINGDGKVNILDYVTLFENFGKSIEI